MSSDTLPGEVFKSDVKPYRGGPHPGAVHGEKFNLFRRIAKGIRGSGSIFRKIYSADSHSLTSHQRVVMSRAARLGLTVKEYEAKFSH